MTAPMSPFPSPSERRRPQGRAAGHALPPTRRPARLLAAAVAASAFAASCGDGPAEPRPEPVPTALTISGASTVRVTERVALTATVLDQAGEPIPGVPVSWASLQPEAAGVDAEGQVTGLKEGTATIEATAGALRAEHALDILPPPTLVLERDALAFSAVGSAETVRAFVDGEPVTVSLSVASEERWHASRPVVTVSGAAVTASGAGRARVEARTAAGLAAELTVEVAPERPYVSGFSLPESPLSPEAPLEAHGWRLDALLSDEPAMDGALRIDGLVPSVTVLDSATVVLALPPVPASQCHGGRAEISVAAAALDLLEPAPTVIRARAGEVDLAVGAYRRLTPEEAECLMVGPGAWTLAFFDARYVPVPDARPPYAKDGMVTARVTDISADPAAASALPPPAAGLAAPDPHAARHLVPPPALTAQTQPWQLGDSIPYSAGGVPGPWLEALRIVNDYYVVASYPDRLPASTLDSIAATLALIDELHGDRLRQLYGLRPAFTNGQLLVAVEPWDTEVGTGGLAWQFGIELYVGSRFWENAEHAYYIFVHELAHTYDLSRLEEARRTHGLAPWRERWNIEGVADHTTYRALAERFGHAFHQNTPAAGKGRLRQLFSTRGRIENGYSEAAALLLHFTDRLAEATGWEWTAAHDTITLATVYNRRGCTERGSGGLPRDCSEFEGLFDVLERHMGDGWNVVDEVLRHALVQSLDGQTPNPELDHPHVQLGDLDRLPEATPLRAWLGQIVQQEYVEGSFGRFTLSEGPGAFALHSSSPDPAWMLVRTREVR